MTPLEALYLLLIYVDYLKRSERRETKLGDALPVHVLETCYKAIAAQSEGD